MTYISDEEIEALPEDPVAKFVGIERIVRARYEDAIERLGDNQSPAPLSRRYMSIVLPAAHEYGIDALKEWEQPAAGADWEIYDRFLADVDFCLTPLRLRLGARVKQYSVAFDAAAKLKLRHLLEEFRGIVDKLEISVAKKDRLHARINALQAEVERERTRYEAFAALMIEAADDVGEAARRLEPVVQLAERIAGVFGGAKRTEDAQVQLPKPEEKKRIEGPASKNGKKSSAFDKSFDDEIPF